jgi:hypothetical protein
MTEFSMFKKNPEHTQALAALSSGQRAAFIAAGIGAIVPVLFLAVIRPVYWVAAFQFACLAALAYIRWRTPAFRGSPIVFILAVVACIVSVMAGFMA